MNINKAIRRDKRKLKKKTGMQVDNRSIFVIVGIQVKKGKKKNG
jgi:hypothetical protein